MVRESRITVATPAHLVEGQVIVARTNYSSHTRHKGKYNSGGSDKIRGFLVSVCAAPLHLFGLKYCRRKMNRDRCYPLTELYNNAYNEILCKESTIDSGAKLPNTK